MKTQYKILLLTTIAIAISVPFVSAMYQEPINAVRCMESDPYPNVEDATKAAQHFMDKYGYTTFVSGSINLPGGVHTSEQEHLPTTITLCIREASTFEP